MTNKLTNLDFRDGALPVYSQIAYKIELSISKGIYPIGELLPSQRELGELYNVSRITIVKALKLIQSRGLISSRQGKGSTVVKRSFQKNNYINQGFSTQFNNEINEIFTKVISCELVSASENISNYLLVMENEEVIKITRVRYIKHIPVCVEHNYYRNISPYKEICFDLKDNDSIYNKLNSKGVIVSYAEERMASILSDSKYNNLLNLKSDMPLLKLIRETYSKEGEERFPVEYCENYYNTDTYGYYGILSINLLPHNEKG